MNGRESYRYDLAIRVSVLIHDEAREAENQTDM